MTTKDLKTKAIEHLQLIDLTKLSMQDISCYVYIIKQLDEIEKGSYLDFLVKNSLGTGFGGNYNPAPIKEVEKNG